MHSRDRHLTYTGYVGKLVVFPGDSQMAGMMRDVDWSHMPLGSEQEWPAHLRTALALVLGSDQPTHLWWGSSLSILYNDACIPWFGYTHPAALGRNGRDAWPDLAPFVDSLIGRKLGEDDPRVFEIPAWCSDAQPTVAMTHRLVPVVGDRGVVDGAFCTCTTADSQSSDVDERVRGLVARLFTVQEDERRRIARDIHDQVGQQLTALRLTIETVFRSSMGTSMVVPAAKTRRLARELDETIDFLAWQLRPAALEQLSLTEALDGLVSSWSLRYKTHAHFAATGHREQRFPALIEDNIYRFVQEALNNVFKHARADRVSVLVTQFNGGMIVSIEDNGRGFSPSPDYNGSGRFGVIGMRERARIIGAELSIQSSPGHGTAIRLRVPEGYLPQASLSHPRADA